MRRAPGLLGTEAEGWFGCRYCRSCVARHSARQAGAARLLQRSKFEIFNFSFYAVNFVLHLLRCNNYAKISPSLGCPLKLVNVKHHRQQKKTTGNGQFFFLFFLPIILIFRVPTLSLDI